MTITSFGRRVRAATALGAGAALLALAGCGTGAESPEDAPAATSDSAAEDTASAPEQVDPADESTDSDAEDGAAGSEDGTDDGDDADSTGDETSGDDEGAGEDGAAMGDRTRIMLRTELGVDDTSGDGALALPAEELAALLAEPFGDTAECSDELLLEPGADPVDCTGPASFDDTAPTEPWVANVVFVPGEGGFQDGARVAVLFSTGEALPETAEELLDEDVTVTGVGFGSMFGVEPLSAEELADSTLQTLTSENAYVPVDEMAEWSEVSCEDGMNFDDFATVGCEASTADGESWELLVAPGTYVDNDQGLLVGIDVRPDA